MAKIVEFIPNFSEGRRQEVIDAISDAARSVDGAKLINVNIEASYNRCVHTIVGNPEAVLDGSEYDLTDHLPVFAKLKINTESKSVAPDT